MSHYKQFSEHRHGRDAAKKRVGDGESGTQHDLKRIRAAGGPAKGIPGRKNGGSVYGQGLASGGEVKMTGGAESGPGRMELAKIQASRRKK